jgi:peptidoglycan/LPS O-acetylase OafA/YrhL
MRRLALILGLVLIAALTIQAGYDFILTSEGLRYFSSEPRRLLDVMFLGIAGGMIALGISRLSPASQRKLKLVALGGFLALALASAAATVTEAGMWGWAAAALVSLVVTAGSLYLEFRRVWRRK